ncbi:phage tail protein [Xenorhabdus innexi]|uniref:Putative E14 prophage tail fiber protein (Modular protein) n=1 Tax=Xenorhabdus innexi TaxID=290109 RepID=A0A1N6MXH2_9GAMM|nr:tail fiber protein [Xenorhabdus innexi]PHM29453.1 tail protein [Xenorhabdus innexi]SIP73536.1 putative E14 prophage; tail fiber protein (Modular protein) [Xenorhabdus innexi]
MSTQDSNSSVVVPTMDDVRKAIKEAIEEHAASRNHPYATHVESGFVTLSDETDSDSELTVATSKAIKKAYDLANNANDNAKLALPVGVPVPWPTETPPEGWLMCNGDSFDISRYPKLALAYPSGNLPDLRGEFIRGWDNKGVVDPERQLLSKQQATMLPSVYTYYYHEEGTGVLVSPPINAYETAEGVEITDFMAKDFDEPAYAPSGKYLSNVLTPEGASSLASFRVRPRNIAFNYIVRAA